MQNTEHGFVPMHAVLDPRVLDRIGADYPMEDVGRTAQHRSCQQLQMGNALGVFPMTFYPQGVRVIPGLRRPERSRKQMPQDVASTSNQTKKYKEVSCH